MAAEQIPNQHLAVIAQIEAQCSKSEERTFWSPSVGETALRHALMTPHTVSETSSGNTQRPDKLPAARREAEAA